MHEFGICDGIVEAVQWRANGRRVARVKVRVGVMHRVVEEAFQQAFSHAAEGTEAENASLDIVVIPVRAVCRSCQAEFESEDIATVCAKCGGMNLDFAAGEELILESIEYEASEQRGNLRRKHVFGNRGANHRIFRLNQGTWRELTFLA